MFCLPRSISTQCVIYICREKASRLVSSLCAIKGKSNGICAERRSDVTGFRTTFRFSKEKTTLNLAALVVAICLFVAKPFNNSTKSMKTVGVMIYMVVCRETQSMCETNSATNHVLPWQCSLHMPCSNERCAKTVYQTILLRFRWPYQ